MMNGTIKEDISPNATMIGTVHATPMFTPETEKFNMCDIFTSEGEAEGKCPPDKGETLLTAVQIFTWLWPDGTNASVRIDLSDVAGRRLTCLQGVVALQQTGGW